MSRPVPVRVVVTQNGISRKFFSLLQGKDGSLYIHPNREKNMPWKIPSLDKHEDITKIGFTNYSMPGFDLHKISFHRSGFIHLTNKKGERYRDGTRGPSFEEMDPLHLLCIIAPSKLEQMPIFECDPKCMVVNLQVPPDVSPFYMTLALAKERVGPAENDGNLLTDRILLPLNSGHYFTFVLREVVPKPGVSANWPPFPFFLLRIAS